VAGRIPSIEKSNDFMGNATSDLPTAFPFSIRNAKWWNIFLRIRLSYKGGISPLFQVGHIYFPGLRKQAVRFKGGEAMLACAVGKLHPC
jgi:hypothetical protein